MGYGFFLTPNGVITTQEYSYLVKADLTWHRTAIARHFTDCLLTEPVLMGYSTSAGKALTAKMECPAHVYIHVPPHGQSVCQELTGGGVWGYERGRGRGGTFVACENKAHVR